jgi:ABC-type bacteriocin/lantibiotic exporter with double-glycine peptidase domain
LRAVLSYWGRNISEEKLINLSGSTFEEGVEAPGLVKAAEAIGLGGFYHDDADFDDLRRYLDLGLPVIVNWWSTDEGHFSVVAGMDNKYIYIVDPEKDERFSRIPLDTFDRVWFDFKEPQQTDLTRRRLIIIAPKDVI